MAKRILTGKISGIVFFICTMALVFHLTFNVVGKALSDLLAQAIDAASFAADSLLISVDAPFFLHSFIMEGIFPGVGSVLSFVPVIGTLFFFLSLLEESGYLSHVSQLMDGPMRHLGLTGRAVIPMIMGFGCNVPAVITAGSLLKGREKNIAIAILPFMSCSARLPIYAMFISAFFEHHRLFIIAAVYLTGIMTAALAALFLKKTPYGSSEASCDALCSSCSSCTYAPQRLRLPSAKNILHAVLQSCTGFVKKAFTVILLASVAVWFLRTFDGGLHPVTDVGASLLADMGKAAAPMFEPVGFGDWRAVSALISGLFAKEAVISTFAILSASGAEACGGSAASLLCETFTPLSAFCFMIFCLLYIPCIATLAAIRQQTGSLKYCLALGALQIITAWGVSFLLFQTGAFV